MANRTTTVDIDILHTKTTVKDLINALQYIKPSAKLLRVYTVVAESTPRESTLTFVESEEKVIEIFGKSK